MIYLVIVYSLKFRIFIIFYGLKIYKLVDKIFVFIFFLIYNRGIGIEVYIYNKLYMFNLEKRENKRYKIIIGL